MALWNLKVYGIVRTFDTPNSRKAAWRLNFLRK